MSDYCQCCGSDCWEKLVKLPASIFDVDCTIERCTSCSFGRSSPGPQIHNEYYDDNTHYVEQFFSNKKLYLSFAKKLLATLAPYVQPEGMRLLDFGCGAGFLVEMAGKMGFEAQGVEANENLVRFGRERKLDILNSQECDFETFLGEPYDIIVFSAVLEHLTNPAAILSQCKNALKPNGLILISQADFEGLLPRLFPWGWYGWLPTEHYWHFTPKSLATMGESLGLEVKGCVKESLHHRWYYSGGPKVILGRNLATLIARVGQMVGQDDGFAMVFQQGRA